ncbi:MAG: hypothetical protein AABZ30_13635, partial [Myxococcota bacterium]
PPRAAGDEAEQGRRWKEVLAEHAALSAWLSGIKDEQRVRVERTGSWFAIRVGPFHVWLSFCERLLRAGIEPRDRSNALWTLGNVAHSAGQLDRALEAARDKVEVDRALGDERGAALAAGLIADILMARGELDEALRICREEELPVYERLGDVRERLVAQANIALLLLRRARRGDREEASGLLAGARAAAERMRLPEARQIQSIQEKFGLV